MTETRLLCDELETPLGTLRLAVSEAGVLKRLGWDAKPPPANQRVRDPFGCTAALRAYFEGEVTAIDALVTEGEGTDFQRRVWKALRRIPASATASYGEIAKAIGAPTASRAVGAANGRNPIAIVVPCHRVIGSDGTLTGYASGLKRKRWLLHHEARFAREAPRQRSLAL